MKYFELIDVGTDDIAAGLKVEKGQWIGRVYDRKTSAVLLEKIGTEKEVRAAVKHEMEAK